MKKNLFYLLMMLFTIGIMVSCDDDDDPIVIDNPVYGFQIEGTATGGKALTIDVAQMVEPSSTWETKAVRDGMNYAIYYLSAGDIAFKNVTQNGETIYGASGAEEVAQEAEAGEEFSFHRGNLISGETSTFTIPTEGLYYIITDETSGTFWVMLINNFEVHTSNDKATMTTGSAEGATFQALGADVRGAFKVRINTAWKIVADDIPCQIAGFEADGIRPITSFGGTLTALSFEGSDIPFEPVAGHLTDFTYTWDPTKKGIEGISIATADAGEKEPTDYSDYLLGFIGTAVTVQDTAWGWGDLSYENKLPTKDGLIYTWEWTNVSIADTVDGKTWKLRKDNAWSFTLGFNSVTMSGGAANDFFAGSDDGNFGIAVAGIYDFTLVVDADNDKWTLTANIAGSATPELYMLGDGCAAGWDNAAALPLQGTGGSYTITAALTSGGFVKFITTPGQWAPMYGTDENGTSTSGNLVYRATEADADPASIPCPDTDGTYTISVNTTDLTYTISSK